MEVICPNCGATGQEAGKFCENCGFAIPADAGASPPGQQPSVADSAQPDPASAVSGVPVQAAAGASPGTSGAGNPGVGGPNVVGAQFVVVRDGRPSLDEGFTITRVGEFLVGRMDPESGTQVDVDVRQWVQPFDVQGQKQYLIHRKQCYIGLTADDLVTLRSYPGYEADTLVKAPGENTFTSLQNLGTKRPARPDGSFELQLNDQIYMGDPDAVMYYLTGDPTAHRSYLVLELINKS
ncbi:MAG: zinc ribbon domain-containing protein [Chloroflexota bacterium]|nr:zinc ribbon domain-containing protein [Chloroflexota bacterium]MDQ5867244.1 zinc ribbon domain-containing protein [Chloroflexota bacterium]